MAALNIQRGRDHGLPGYNLYRAICNLTRADDFNGLRREIAPPVIERLRRTYAHVDDVDLFTGLYFFLQNSFFHFEQLWICNSGCPCL